MKSPTVSWDIRVPGPMRPPTWEGYRLTSPLVSFATSAHDGPLGSAFSLVHINDRGIRILALKKAEDSDAIVIRLVELHGQEHKKVAISFAAPVISAKEANGQEDIKGAATLSDGAIEASFAPYQPRTFELQLAKAPAKDRSIKYLPSSWNTTGLLQGTMTKGLWTVSISAQCASC